MTPQAPMLQGWCPGALRPMLSGDGLVVRVRPHAGRLLAAQAAGIAALAEMHGNGAIDLSSRGNLQLRGIGAAGYPEVIAGLRALGLIDATPEIESRRNILVTPFWQPGDGTPDLAFALAAALAADGAPDLPGKFGFAVDCGPSPVLRAASADIRLERGADGSLICRAEGAALGTAVTTDTAIAAMIAMARWFVAMGGARDGRGRMRALTAQGAVWAQAGVPVVIKQHRPEPPLPGLYAPGVLLGLEFGQMQTETLRALAGLGPMRLTPWRMLLIEGATAMPPIAGLITEPDDPALRVIACTGAPGCPQAAGPTRDLARDLAMHVPEGRLLHVSGCAKACAHPGAADLTLLARPGGYDLIRNGSTSDRPGRIGLTAAELLARPSLLADPAAFSDTMTKAP